MPHEEKDPANPAQRSPKIKIVKDGPYAVSGGLPLGTDVIVSNQFGIGLRWEQGEDFPHKETYTLCRCGHSRNKPYCDNSHIGSGFDGTETASREPYLDQAETIEGPALNLTDANILCASARFCDRSGGTWNLTRRSDNPKFRETAITEAGQCPSGRLVARDKESGRPIEPELAPSIGAVEDPFTECSGPLWVKGGVPVESADGTVYEVRHRVTLCRCGRSRNKPFCDSRHLPSGQRHEDAEENER
ncbi:MAG: CDGSH iron-sulfur domain-containing protein [Spirochaetales bacterium]|nr:CDGSH iron-sulfur domain-containing protein [Spirochaetales bacterium]